MIIKMLWIALMIIVIMGVLFFSAIGIDVPIAYYEKTEVLIANENN